MESIRAVVLDIKHMNHYVLRELETSNYHRFVKLERDLQNYYEEMETEGTHNVFRVGMPVAVKILLNGDPRGLRRWLRGVIRQNYQQKDYFFAVFFIDYGFEKTCLKSDMRPLHSDHWTKKFAAQAFNFYLTDVDHKQSVKREDVLKEVRNLLEEKQFTISITIEGRGRKGSIYGSIILEEDCDLAAILLEKELVDDVHYCGQSRRRADAETSLSSVGSPDSQNSGRLPGPFRSAHKAGRVHCDLVCKCNDIVKYKRKLMRDALKDKLVDNNKSQTQRFLNSV